MRRIVLSLVAILFLFTDYSYAHGVYVAGGTYGGRQVCRSEYGMADSIYASEIQELKEEMRNAALERKEKRLALKGLERKIERAEERLLGERGVLKPRVARAVIKHAKGGFYQSDYGACGRVSGSDAGDFDEVGGVSYCYLSPENNENCDENRNGQEIQEPWGNFCADPEISDMRRFTSPAILKDSGLVNSEICEDNAFNKSMYNNIDNVSNRDVRKFRSDRIGRCKKYVENLAENYRKKESLEEWLANYEESVELRKERIADLNEDMRDEIRENRELGLEGGICPDCAASRIPKRDKWDVIGGLAGGILMGAAGHYGADQISKRNVKMGWPTDPRIGHMAGYMGLQAAIYGGLYGGVGQGGFACAQPGGPFGRIGYNGGAFGYPRAWAGYPGGIPGAFPGGQAAGSMIGFGMGAPIGVNYGVPFAPYAGGFGAPFTGGFGVVAGGAFAPYAGGFGAPMAGGFGAPMAPPFAFGSAAGGGFGAPYAGGFGAPFAGGFGTVAGGAFAPYAGGFGAPYAGGFGAPFSSGFGAMVAFPAGVPAGAPYMNAGFGNQMQQQYMQQYQAQMRAYAQYQQRMQQQQQQKQYMVQRLSQELMRIQMQIQEIQYGAGGGFSFGGSIGGSVGFGGGGPISGPPPRGGTPNRPSR